MRIWKNITIFYILPAFAILSAQELQEQYSARGQAYGLAYDGQNFWYSEPASRKVFRLDSRGRSQAFYLGNRKIYGLRFNPADGHIYVGSEKEILKINPVAGNLAGRIPVAVEKIAGLDFSGNLWYLLEKDTGTIHYYDQELNRIISSFTTGCQDARDLTVNRNSFWITDGKTDQILRYSMEEKRLTGTLRAPENARGLSFTRNQLWVVNRNKQNIERLSYSDSQYYLTSGEFKHRLKITTSFSILTPGEVIIMQAGNTPYQSVRSIETKDSRWETRYLPSGQKAFAATLSSGSHEFTYECQITARNANYLVPEPYTGRSEELESSQARDYYKNSARFSRANPVAILKELPASPTLWQETLQNQGLPVRSAGSFQRNEKGEYARLPDEWQAYLRGLGWLPLSGRLSALAYARTTEQVELFVSPGDSADGLSMVYLQNGQSLRAVGSTVKVEHISL